MESIALIDRHPVVRSGLGAIIKHHFSNVLIHESDNFLQFAASGSGAGIDLIVLGDTSDLIHTQHKSITQIRRINSRFQLIMFEEKPDLAKIAMYSKLGAAGYLTKASDMPEFLKCIADVRAGKYYLSNEILEVMLTNPVECNKPGGRASRSKLTNREYEIAVYLSHGESTSSISKRLDRKASTISTIKKNIFRKLNIKDILKLRDYLEVRID